MAAPNPKNPAPGTAIPVDVRVLPSLDPQRMGQKDTFVSYQVATGNVYVVTVPGEKPTPEAVAKAIKDDVAHRGKILAQVVQL